MAVATKAKTKVKAAKSTDDRSGVIVSTSPSSGRTLGEVQITTPDEVTEIMERARKAQPDWYALGIKQRTAMMRKLLHAMYRNADRIIDTLIAEAGKPRFEAYVELWPTLELIAHACRIAKRTLAPRRVGIVLIPHRLHWVVRRPHGVVLVISPWNFPLVLSMTPVVEALITGNVV